MRRSARHRTGRRGALRVRGLKCALAELPERPRLVLESISVEDVTAHEAATHLQVSLRTVENDPG
ncbi:sigma factor-like helix-turn-helix DNA-binding protein [Bradyrhizobium sp. I1.14.4]|uniref:sigma factor-like helix-turn-helix DNA-binding protein n=1 Tax=unclassified Bradyrhizobium TaxID=2631580 RepID=UPI003D1ED12F